MTVTQIVSPTVTQVVIQVVIQVVTPTVTQHRLSEWLHVPCLPLPLIVWWGTWRGGKDIQCINRWLYSITWQSHDNTSHMIWYHHRTDTWQHKSLMRKDSKNDCVFHFLNMNKLLNKIIMILPCQQMHLIRANVNCGNVSNYFLNPHSIYRDNCHF